MRLLLTLFSYNMSNCLHWPNGGDIFLAGTYNNGLRLSFSYVLALSVRVAVHKGLIRNAMGAMHQLHSRRATNRGLQRSYLQ